MTKKSLPLSEVYRLLEPGPVVMLATSDKGKPNVMTMSWHMMVDFEPPILACVVSNGDYSFNALKKTGECTVNIPAANLAKKVVACGNSSGETTDKFKKFGLTPKASACVKAPRVEECYANFECRVVDKSLVTKYNIFILEVVKAWIDPARKNPRTIHHRGKGVFAIDGKIIKLPSKMK